MGWRSWSWRPCSYTEVVIGERECRKTIVILGPGVEERVAEAGVTSKARVASVPPVSISRDLEEAWQEKDLRM